jgi:hypothetical protein
MKKIILICSLLVLGTGVTLSTQFSDHDDLKPTEVNVPDNLYTEGKWPDPLDVEPFKDEEEFWTIVNNTQCAILYRQWFDGQSTALLPLGPTYHFNTVSAGGTNVISFGDLRSKYPSATVKFIEYSAFEFTISGMPSWISHGLGTSNYPTGLQPPCDCVKITQNSATRTVTIDPC